MVVALEPGVYEGREGARVEVVVLVTEDGHELLSRYSLDLER
jgi:Xaa-Pro aminopeptidase